MDLDRVIRLTFRSNGQNWEKYLRWLNRLSLMLFVLARYEENRAGRAAKPART